MVGGLEAKPTDKVKLGLDLAWIVADAALQQFRLPEGEAFADGRPHQSYDFSQTHLNSDLDIERVEAGLWGKFKLNPRIWLTAGYRVVDYDDKAPYLYDTTGTVDFYYARLGWSF